MYPGLEGCGGEDGLGLVAGNEVGKKCPQIMCLFAATKNMFRGLEED